jgi:hypothetical protein
LEEKKTKKKERKEKIEEEEKCEKRRKRAIKMKGKRALLSDALGLKRPHIPTPPHPAVSVGSLTILRTAYEIHCNRPSVCTLQTAREPLKEFS